MRSGGSGKHQQRVVVTVTPRGHNQKSWTSYGRGYLQQEGKGQDKGKAIGFDRDATDIDLGQKMGEWQKQNDKSYYHVVISPERGKDLDLQQFTRDFMRHVEERLRTKVEWGAAVHYDKPQHHVHLVMRERDERGNPLNLTATHEQQLTGVARQLATQKLGYRMADYDLSRREHLLGREQITDVDRDLIRRADKNHIVDLSQERPANVAQEAKLNQEQRRLAYLSGLGLAKEIEPKKWELYHDLNKELHFRGLNIEHAPEWRKPKEQEVSREKEQEQNKERARTIVRAIAQEKSLGLGRSR
jgi:type IV secretory pathway VirD2 relaxase